KDPVTDPPTIDVRDVVAESDDAQARPRDCTRERELLAQQRSPGLLAEHWRGRRIVTTDPPCGPIGRREQARFEARRLAPPSRLTGRGRPDPDSPEVAGVRSERRAGVRHVALFRRGDLAAVPHVRPTDADEARVGGDRDLIGTLHDPGAIALELPREA